MSDTYRTLTLFDQVGDRRLSYKRTKGPVGSTTGRPLPQIASKSQLSRHLVKS